MIGITSLRLSRMPNLKTFLNGADCRFATPWNLQRIDHIAGWGLKPSGIKAQRLARKHDIPCLLLEDGFLRSLMPSDPPFSILIERGKVYYDAASPGRLDQLLEQKLSPAQQTRATYLIEAWKKARVSKYNQWREYEGSLPSPYVLVVDQLCNDASIRHGMANAASFHTMLDTALAENPHCTIVVKSHPLATAKGKRGNLHPVGYAGNPRIRFITEPCSPVRLIEEAEAVYTVTSQLGFEALIHGKPVRTFGMPFYAGRGLTEDRLSAPRWRRPVGLETLVHASLVDYPRYVDPETGSRCEIETVLDYLSLQSRMRERFPATVHAIGFSLWKKRHLRHFLSGPQLRFVRSTRQLPAEATAVVWGSRPAKLSASMKIIRVEDGFLRSAGLGADLAQPLSWSFDDIGIHYDPSRPSRLETLLATTVFDEDLMARASALRRRITAAGITKYNLRGAPWLPPQTKARIILVPGQVADDASILFGAADIKTNLHLSQAVRAANPDAWIVYKPHPDIAARLRRKGVDDTEIARHCDEVLHDASMADVLTSVDEVHTLTSLTGFEALLRGKQVTCYGSPFYAGWGLTRDIHPLPRRKRSLRLNELVAAALILYPTYVSSRTNRYTTPERTIDEIISLSDRSSPRYGLHSLLLRPLLRIQSRRRFREAVLQMPQDMK